MSKLSRRSFFTGLTAALAAPAIVPASSLMQIRGLILPRYVTGTEILARWRMYTAWEQAVIAEYRRDSLFFSGEQWKLVDPARV